MAAARRVGRAPGARHALAVLGAARTTSATTSSAALVEGTLLAAYRFDAYKPRRPTTRRRLERLCVSAHDDVSAAVEARA